MGEEEKPQAPDANAEGKRKPRKATKPKPAAEPQPAEPAKEAKRTWINGVSNELVVAAAIVVAIIAALAIIGGQGPADASQTTTTLKAVKNPDIAEKYDVATVDYTGMFLNGSVFDTSVEATAEEAGILNPLREYKPITFTLGYGGIIEGFEEAVTGMRIGEEKEVTIPSKRAYGPPRNDLIQSVAREQKSPLVQNVSVEKFREDISLDPYVGLTFTLENRTAYDIAWPMTVLAVTNDTVTFKYNPTTNATIDTVFGKAEVYGTDTDIVIKVNPTAGQRIVTLSGNARVVSVDDEEVTLDFNHELAGHDLKFRIKLVGVVKQQ